MQAWFSTTAPPRDADDARGETASAVVGSGVVVVVLLVVGSGVVVVVLLVVLVQKLLLL